MPCSTKTVASGTLSLRWTRPRLAVMPPTRSAMGMIARGLWRARDAMRIVDTQRIAQRPLDDVIEDRERHIREQNARDRLVDPAPRTQPAGKYDRDRAVHEL